MQQRMELIRRMPFRGIVTTNFSTIVPGKSPHDDDCPYRNILRAGDCPEDFMHNGLPPVIQAHGRFDLPESVVFTRTGYRQLLYKFPEVRARVLECRRLTWAAFCGRVFVCAVFRLALHLPAHQAYAVHLFIFSS